MRNLILSMTALASIVALGAGCGPSGHAIAKAKTTRYQGDKLTMFTALKTVTENKHKLRESDETRLIVVTKARWYTPEGIASNWGPDDVMGAGDAAGNPSEVPRGTPGVDGRARMQDRSLLVFLVVKLLPEGSDWIVYIEPVIWEYRVGKPNLDRIRAGSQAVPGWATGKVDQLAFEIYEVLKKYEVKGAGGNIPPPASEPPKQEPPPTEPPPATEPAPATEPTGSPS